MVEISLSGSGEGQGWVTAPGYSTTAAVQNVLRRSRDISFTQSGLEPFVRALRMRRSSLGRQRNDRHDPRPLRGQRDYGR